MEILNCNKCNKEVLENEGVWCNTCGLSYCKECSVIGLPVNYPLPVNILDGVCEDEWDGDLGFVTDECVNCYMNWIPYDELPSEIKYKNEDLVKID